MPHVTPEEAAKAIHCNFPSLIAAFNYAHRWFAAQGEAWCDLLAVELFHRSRNRETHPCA